MRLGWLVLVALAGCAHSGPGVVSEVSPTPSPRAGVDVAPAVGPACPPRSARLVFASMPPALDSSAAINFHPNLAVSPDSRLVAAPTMDGRIYVVDVELGANRAELVGHRGEARAVAFVDARTLASVGGDRVLRLWDLVGGGLVVEVDVGVELTALAASPRDGSLLVGAKDGKLRLYDRTGGARPVLEGHRDAVARVAWREDGGAFASSGRDRTVYHYASDGTNKTLLHTLGGGVDSLSFQPGTGRVTIDWGLRDVIRLLAQDRSFTELSRWSDRIGSLSNAQVNPVFLSLAFSPDGQKLAFATCGSHISGHEFAARFGVVDVATDAPRFFDGPYGNAMTCPVAMVWTPDGRHIVRMSDRHALALSSPDTGRPTGHLPSPLEQPFGPRREAEGKKAAFEVRMAAALGVTLLPVRDDACEALRKRSARDARGFACNAAIGRAFAGDILGGIHVHDARTGAELSSYDPRSRYGARRATTHVAVAPDGKLVASWAEDGTLVITDARSPYEIRLERRGIGVVTRLAWTADGRQLALFSGPVLRMLRVADGGMLRVELGIASDDSGAFEDLGPQAAAFDLLDHGSPLARARAALHVRVGDLATGDLVSLERAAPASRPGLVRAWLAGQPSIRPMLAICSPSDPRR